MSETPDKTPSNPPSTLLLTGLWFVLGGGLLMPLFFLAPGFFADTGHPFFDKARIGGSIFYFILAVSILIPVTRRYLRKGPSSQEGPTP